MATVSSDPWIISTSARTAKVRTLFVVHVPPAEHGAVYKQTLERTSFLEHQGFECIIISPDHLPWTRKFSARFTRLVYPVELAVWLFRRAANYDIVVFHSYSGWLTTVVSRFFPRFRQLKTVIEFHGLEPLYFHRQEEEARRSNNPLSYRYRFVSGTLMSAALRHACQQADAVFCLNTEESRFLVEHGWAPPSGIKQYANASKDTFFFLERQHAPTVRRILFVGQWLPMKGIRYLAEAFRHVCNERPGVTLVCAGTSASRDRVLEDFPADIRSRVDVIPSFRSSELIELQKSCDLFVFPTLSEGFSLALIEAAAAGLPIITTPVGAAPDILQHGSSAIFCDPGNAESLKRAISELLDDDATRERLGKQAQEAARAFRQEIVFSEYTECLREILHRATRPSNA